MVPSSSEASRTGINIDENRQIMQQQQQQIAHGSIVLKELGVNKCEIGKMLVIFDTGEQRLITFTLPKETCTVQELLDQVGIKVDIDSPIECIENSGKLIDYIVIVGHCRAAMDIAAITKAVENHVKKQRNVQNPQHVIRDPHKIVQVQQIAHGSIALKELGVNECEIGKMLVIFDTGEQRLITFTLPKETCTVQELLDQVGIKVDIDSPIECIENSGKLIDYIVKVGHCRAAMDIAAITKAVEKHVRQQQHQKQLLLEQQSEV